MESPLVTTLRFVGLRYDSQYKVVICTSCRIGHPEPFGHIRSHHGALWRRSDTREKETLEILLGDLHIDRNPRVNSVIENIENIQIHSGFKCSVPDCTYCAKELSTMRKHHIHTHRNVVKSIPKRVQVQTFYIVPTVYFEVVDRGEPGRSDFLTAMASVQFHCDTTPTHQFTDTYNCVCFFSYFFIF